MATERTLWVSNHSRSACNCEVTVPNSSGGPPAIDTYICSLPTSTNAACGSRTGKSLIHHTVYGAAAGVRPVVAHDCLRQTALLSQAVENLDDKAMSRTHAKESSLPCAVTFAGPLKRHARLGRPFEDQVRELHRNWRRKRSRVGAEIQEAGDCIFRLQSKSSFDVWIVSRIASLPSSTIDQC